MNYERKGAGLGYYALDQDATHSGICGSNPSLPLAYRVYGTPVCLTVEEQAWGAEWCQDATKNQGPSRSCSFRSGGVMVPGKVYCCKEGWIAGLQSKIAAAREPALDPAKVAALFKGVRVFVADVVQDEVENGTDDRVIEEAGILPFRLTWKQAGIGAGILAAVGLIVLWRKR